MFNELVFNELVFNELMFNDLLLNDLTSLSHSFVNTLSRLFVHSSYSTLAALNIGRFGCGMSLRSDGWIGWLITLVD